MKTKAREKAAVTVTLLRGLALVSKRAAVAGAGLASRWGHDQPKTPLQLREWARQAIGSVLSDC